MSKKNNEKNAPQGAGGAKGSKSSDPKQRSKQKKIILVRSWYGVYTSWRWTVLRWTVLRMLRTVCKSLERILVIGVSEILPFSYFHVFWKEKKINYPKS